MNDFINRERRDEPRGAPAEETGGALCDDLLWGIRNIAKEIGRSERQTLYLLEKRRLPASKTGGIWCSSRTALRSFFSARFVMMEVA